MTVRLRDSAGNPVVGVPINWTVLSGQGTINPAVSTTDANGVASSDYTGINFGIGQVTSPAEIQATTGAETVSFLVTTLPSTAAGQSTTINAYLDKPTTRAVTLRAGEVGGGAVQITAVTSIGIPIRNVGLRVVAADPTQSAQAACVGTYLLTNDQGVATCDLVASGSGTGSLNVVIGSQVRYPITLTVTPGGPNRLTVTGGNGQTGAPGSQLANALTATLTDSNGTPLSNTAVNFDVVSGSATLSTTTATTDSQGVASTRVTLGNAPGPVQIRVRTADGTVSATFTVTAISSAASFTVAGGDAQIAATGQPFATPLQIRVLDANNAPVVGTPVTFAVTSGSATLATTSAPTNAQGIATVNITAGSASGPVVVTATSGALTARFNLTVRTPGPVFTASSIVNGASFQAGISPGSIATIFASGIAPTLRGSTTSGLVGPLATKLADVEVLINGINAPIYSVSNVNGQESVTIQVPYEVNPGVASVTVRTAGGGTTTVDNVQVNQVSPAVFETTDPVNNRRYAVGYRQDGTAISSTNPARRGDIIRIFATGLGQTSPGTGTNRIAAAGQTVSAPIVVGLGNAGVRLVSAEALPGSVGIYVLTIEVPADAQTNVASPVGLFVTGPNGQQVVAASSSIPIQ